jgi:hypothetical protein
MQIVSEHYIEGIKEGRAAFKREGLEFGADHLTNLSRTIKGFAASSPVGQMLRGERDFWINQLAKATTP